MKARADENKTLYLHFTKSETTRQYNMKFISWNVNGLRACREKGFEEAFAQLDADCFCLQETKLQEGQIDLQFEGYESYWDRSEEHTSELQSQR